MRPIPPLTPLRWPGQGRSKVTVLSPNDGKKLGDVEQLSVADVEWLAGLVLVGQDKLQGIPHRTRADWLNGVAKKIRTDRAALGMLVATEGGKPLKDALVEVDRAANTFELCAHEALALGGEVLPLAHTAPGANKLSFTLREPIGPVLALSAFNHPLNLLAHQVGTALAAGCAVVFKPSRGTPYCGEWLADALQELGVPPEVAIVCHAEVEQILQLCSRSEFQFVSFIGSAKVGWDLRRKIANGTRLALEHGGQAPAIVWDDAKLDEAVASLVKGAFYHAGQVCISTQKIFVHEKVASTFTQLFCAATQKLVTGDAREASTDVGPLIRPEEKQRVIQWIDEALKDGAKIAQGTIDRSPGNFLAPVVLTGVSPRSKIWHEEVFGPIVNINSFSDAEEVYADVADSPYHFEAAVFTQSLPRALEGVRRLSAMTVMVNEATTFRVDAMPFGGHRQSGLGMGGVKYAVEELTRMKQVVINGFA